jgi:carboxyl-terminal processing protease
MKRTKIYLILIFLFVTGFILNRADEYFEIMRSIELFGSTYKEIIANYVDNVSPRNLMKRGINGMLQGLDPFSNFFDETEKGEIDLLTTGKYGGIGILIDSKGGELVVMEVMPGYAAQRQGIKVGDVILSIDDEIVTPQNINKLTFKVRGQPGTEVKLKIKRPIENKILEFHLIREEIKVQNISLASFVDEQDGIYYIKLDRFSKRVSEEFFEKIKEAKSSGNLNGIIIDLRSNPGGLLQAAIELLEFFVPKGEMLLFTKGRSEESKQEFYSRTTPQLEDIPLVILIDENSASASEIVAGTIQDLDRGIIVGSKSFGKGLVQTVYPLPYDASLKLTTARYYTPSGRCIQKLNYLNKIDDVIETKSDTIKIFFTKNKRKVYGDGGVSPDTIVKHNGKPEILNELLNKGMFFKFVSEIILPDKNFKVKDINQSQLILKFVQYLENVKFSYEPSYKKGLKELIKQVESNGNQKKLLNELKELNEKTKFDLKMEVLSHEEIIYSKIISEIANQLKNSELQMKVLKQFDEDVKVAISFLSNKDLYNKFLSLK